MGFNKEAYPESNVVRTKAIRTQKMPYRTEAVYLADTSKKREYGSDSHHPKVPFCLSRWVRAKAIIKKPYGRATVQYSKYCG
jgi:hypothetical protein